MARKQAILIRIDGLGTVIADLLVSTMAELRPGDIVILDNLSSHKRAQVNALIQGWRR